MFGGVGLEEEDASGAGQFMASTKERLDRLSRIAIVGGMVRERDHRIIGVLAIEILERFRRVFEVFDFGKPSALSSDFDAERIDFTAHESLHHFRDRYSQESGIGAYLEDFFPLKEFSKAHGLNSRVGVSQTAHAKTRTTLIKVTFSVIVTLPLVGGMQENLVYFLVEGEPFRISRQPGIIALPVEQRELASF